jgi:hypothetical protein
MHVNPRAVKKVARAFLHCRSTRLGEKDRPRAVPRETSQPDKAAEKPGSSPSMAVDTLLVSLEFALK